MSNANKPIRARLLSAALLACCPSAFALNPALDVSQYAHTAWKMRDGFPAAQVETISQTEDGYLWLGTRAGLFRFDGVRATQWQPPAGQQLPSDYVTRTLAGRDGALWIGTRAGLVSWKNGKLTQYHQLDGLWTGSLLQDREGTVWAGGFTYTPPGELCAIDSVKVECHGDNGSLGNGVVGLREDRKGNLWVGTRTGLWRWRPGAPQFFPLPAGIFGIHALAEDDAGLLIALPGRTSRLVEGKVETVYPYPPQARNSEALHVLRDRDGGLWIGTIDQGLVHVHEGRTDAFAQVDELSGNAISALFEDREGNIWVASTAGLDRFRDYAVVTVSTKQGLGTVRPGAVLAARDGSIWINTSIGLTRWRNGQAAVLRSTELAPGAQLLSLLQDHAGRIWVAGFDGVGSIENGHLVRAKGVPGKVVYSMAEDREGTLWIADQDRGLIEMRSGALVRQTPWAVLGHKDHALSLAADPARGGLWVGFFEGGVVHWKDGQVRESYGSAAGLGSGAVQGLLFDRHGTLCAATEGGLSRLEGGRFTTFGARDGLPCDAVNWVMEDDAGALWLSMSCGLVRVESPQHGRPLQANVFDSSDGVAATKTVGYVGPTVAKSPDGKIWFPSYDGLSVLDPRHVPHNKLPPPVHIERIIVNGKPTDLKPGMRLPALVRNLTIDYTALSLAVPEKVHFRFKLEGQDPDWREVVNDREVQYSNLPPLSYRFRVMASNNSGVWNETGDTLEFSIAPAYYQTTWFYASCVAAFLFMLWALYRLRLHQIAREFNAQLDGRVDERMRVARELHDTMLQSFQAALIQMQAARNIFARRPEKSEESLDKAIETAAGAIAEGRSAIQDLRLYPAGGGDLAELLTTASQGMARSEEAPENPPVFGMTVEGERRDLAPLIQDEVYRIARELLRNAFRHSRAERIEVEIRYDSRQLRLHVRDDGKGIDPEILKAGGRAGHYGFPGMRERASRFGGKLEFWSEAGAGTEAVLTVPGAVAYGASNGGRISFLRRKKTGT